MNNKRSDNFKKKRVLLRTVKKVKRPHYPYYFFFFPLFLFFFLYLIRRSQSNGTRARVSSCTPGRRAHPAAARAWAAPGNALGHGPPPTPRPPQSQLPPRAPPSSTSRYVINFSYSKISQTCMDKFSNPEQILNHGYHQNALVSSLDSEMLSEADSSPSQYSIIIVVLVP
jgi:hypothetical protein